MRPRILLVLLACWLFGSTGALAISLSAAPNPAAPGQNVTVNLNATFTTGPDDSAPPPLSCPVTVNFGDGTSSSVNCSFTFCSQSFSHSYGTPGLYTLQASVPIDNRCKSAPNPGSTILTVACPSLSITTGATLPSAIAGQPYTTQITASGGQLPYTFNLFDSTLPAGLTLSPSGMISGTPASAGNYSFRVRVSDSCATGSQTANRLFTLTVAAPSCPALSIAPYSGPTALTVAQNFSAQLVATGGQAPVAFSLLSGSLPPGITLTGSGLLTGTPTTPGSYPFTVRASDSCGSVQTADLFITLQVAPAPVTCPALLLLTGSPLPAGTTGQPYSSQFQTAGGEGAVSFALTSGALPTGLQLSTSGLLTGIPVTAGTFSFNLQVSDSCPAAPQVVTRGYQIFITEAAAPANLTVVPATFSIPRRATATQTLTYRITAPDQASGSFLSTEGFFRLGEAEVGRVSTPVRVDLSGGVGLAQESLQIPLAVARRVEADGSAQFTFERTFSGTGGVLRSNVPITLTTGAAGDLRIARLQLTFDNGRAEITVPRNRPGLRVTSVLEFTGSGQLQGYWEVDGRLLIPVTEHLVYGRSITLTTPEVPYLPTFVEGSHRVRLVLTQPEIAPIPEAVYFVTARESTEALEPIRLLTPSHLARSEFKPLRFGWEGSQRMTVYLIEFFETEGSPPVASAYTRQAGYDLPEAILHGSLHDGKAYLWRVRGFDEEGALLGESPLFKFSF